MRLKKDKHPELFLDLSSNSKTAKILMSFKMEVGTFIILLIFLAINILRDGINKIDLYINYTNLRESKNDVYQV